MLNYKKAISAIAMLFTLINAVVMPAGAAVTDSPITAYDGKAVVGNGMPGVVIIASYDKNGKLTDVKTKSIPKNGFSNFDTKEGDKIMFWNGLSTMSSFADAYTVPKNNSGTYNKDVYESAVQNALREALGKNMGKDMTEFQKALALHDWLVLNCRYDESKARTNTHSAYGAIVEGFAVCDGYAKAYNDLLGRVGITAEKVEGFKKISASGDPQPHAWSRVTINGIKYYVDVTGDDPVPDVIGRVGHTYFLVSDTQLKRSDYSGYTTHCTDTTYEKNDLLRGWHTAFKWDEDKKAFYYVDVDKVKTTADFTETFSTDGEKPTSYVMTDDGKYFLFYKPDHDTSKGIVYIYSFETDKYYKHAIENVESNVTFDRLRQNGNKIEAVADYTIGKYHLPYSSRVDASIPIPSSLKERSVNFDLNYSNTKTTSCKYIDKYWTNGDGMFYEPKRYGLTFGGWYTKKDGGTKVENFDEILGDNVTLYAHWWGDWKISQQPTLTESGKASRSLDGYPNVKDEIIIPNLSDTAVWEKRTIPSTTTSEGSEIYKSEYGTVVIKLPKKPVEEYDIFLKDGKVYITVAKEDKYTVTFESGGTTASKIIITYEARENYGPIKIPSYFKPSGKVTATLYDSAGNELAKVEYEV